MKVMVIVKATKESEAGMMPDEKVIAEMGKFKEELCLRLQRGCGVRGWGRDGLGTGAQGRGREGAEGVDVDYAPTWSMAGWSLPFCGVDHAVLL